MAIIQFYEKSPQSDWSVYIDGVFHSKLTEKPQSTFEASEILSKIVDLERKENPALEQARFELRVLDYFVQAPPVGEANAKFVTYQGENPWH